MNAKFSRDEVLGFLDFLAEKGLMKKATVLSRKAAVNTLLSILDDEEAQDISALQIDELLHRFGNKKGQDFKPASLQVYKSRLNSVLSDFRRYKASPLSYKPQHTQKTRAARPETSDVADQSRQESGPENAGQTQQSVVSSQHDEVIDIVFPIPIRRGVIVMVSGLPSDLTPEEASKIGNVILALSGSQEE